MATAASAASIFLVQCLPQAGAQQGPVKSDALAAWRHVLRWDQLKNGAGKERPFEGSKESVASGKEPLCFTLRGTAVQLFNDFEVRISKKAVIHRRVRLKTVMAPKACQQNVWVGMLLSDYDWAENGVLELARQIQSEYWSLVSNSYARRSSSPSPRPTSSCPSGWTPHERAAEGR